MLANFIVNNAANDELITRAPTTVVSLADCAAMALVSTAALASAANGGGSRCFWRRTNKVARQLELASFRSWRVQLVQLESQRLRFSLQRKIEK